MQTAVDDLLTVHDHISTAGHWITPLREALDGVTAAEAAWKPAADERSIWEITLHVTGWTEWAAGFLRGQDTEVTDWPPVATGEAAAWEAARARLDAALEAFRAGIAARTPDDLFVAPTPAVTATSRFVGIQSILVHNAYHAGQITKLRERRAAE